MNRKLFMVDDKEDESWKDENNPFKATIPPGLGKHREESIKVLVFWKPRRSALSTYRYLT
jgi:hypothetical protein